VPDERSRTCIRVLTKVFVDIDEIFRQ
jgi:hypothetical protein